MKIKLSSFTYAHVKKFQRPAFITLLVGVLLFLPFRIVTQAFSGENPFAPEIANANAAATISFPLLYTFNSAGTLYEASPMTNSTSPYLWLNSGTSMIIANGVGETGSSQGSFRLFMRDTVQNPSAQIYVDRVADNLSNTANIHGYNGESVIARYEDANNYYYAGIRTDGAVVIKKKTNGVYQTLASKQIFPGTYNATTNPDLIPLGQWIGLKLVVATASSGEPVLSLYTDIGRTGAWHLALSVVDDPAKFGSAVTGSGLVGVQSDYANAQFSNFLIASANPPPTTPPPTTTYDSVVLSDSPVMYLTMGGAASGSESDKTGHGNNGTYKGGTPLSVVMPNGDMAADFNGSSQYLTVPSAPALSIPTTHELTWEGWIRPNTLQFANVSSDGYVDWMGKCQNYSPACEWEARMYNAVTSQNRPDRLSAYVFNSSAGLGSAADWQPNTNLLQAGQWLHVVAEYQTLTTPSGCSSAYPGSINIWVNGVEQNFADHSPTGCMSQFNITPKAGSSPLDIGTMAMDTWFKGAVGKVAVYNYLLTQTQINNHFQAMTGAQSSGSCGATCTIPVPTP
ncbi:MAG: LamG-like jellyroll fold domain-containing protein [Minisyncoccota bacterium]